MKLLLWVGLVLALTAVGCQNRPYHPRKQASAMDALGAQSINVNGDGSATRLGNNRQKLWTVRWKTAQLTREKTGSFSGAMQSVTGDIFDRKTVAATYSADRADASKADNHLTLDGKVVVKSKAYNALLYCDSITYLPESNRITASGHVRIETPTGVLNPGQDVVTTPDLAQIATPEMFGK